MTKLKAMRLYYGLKLKEVARAVGVTISAVHDAEVRGLRTPRSAEKFAKAFPRCTWCELLEFPLNSTQDCELNK